MKIAKIEQFRPKPRTRLVKVTTDNGLVGWGETTLEGKTIDKFVKAAYMMREWVGDEVDLFFDFHAKMTPALAIEVCNEIKGMRPGFVEEPIPQENRTPWRSSRGLCPSR